MKKDSTRSVLISHPLFRKPLTHDKGPTLITSSDFDYLPKAVPPNTTNLLRIKFPTYEILGNTFNSWHKLSQNTSKNIRQRFEIFTWIKSYFEINCNLWHFSQDNFRNDECNSMSSRIILKMGVAMEEKGKQRNATEKSKILDRNIVMSPWNWWKDLQLPVSWDARAVT